MLALPRRCHPPSVLVTVVYQSFRRFAYYNIKAKELKKIGKNGIVQMDIQLSPGNYSIAFNQDVLGSMLTGSMSLINNMFGK